MTDTNELITLADIEKATMLNGEKLKPLAGLFITPVAPDSLVTFYEQEFFEQTQISPIVVFDRMIRANQCHEKIISYGLHRDSKIICPDYNTRLSLVDLLTREELLYSVDSHISYYEGVIFHSGNEIYPRETVNDLCQLGYLKLLKKILNTHGNNSNRKILAYTDRIIASRDSQTPSDLYDIASPIFLGLYKLMEM